MIPALLLLATVATAPDTIRFTLPSWSAGRDCTPLVGVRAGTKYLRLWVWNKSLPESDPNFNRWQPFYRLTSPKSGQWDGARRTFLIPVHLCRDSCRVKVAVGDSSLNWAGRGCGGDAEIEVKR